MCQALTEKAFSGFSTFAWLLYLTSLSPTHMGRGDIFFVRSRYSFLPSGSSWPVAPAGPWCLAPGSGNRCRSDKLNGGKKKHRNRKEKEKKSDREAFRWEIKRVKENHSSLAWLFGRGTWWPVTDKRGKASHSCLLFVFGLLLALVSIIKRQGVITCLIDQWQRQWHGGGLVS